MAALRTLTALALLLLAACTVGPEYRKPDVGDLVPQDWRWKIAAPRDAAPKGEWWKVFGDPVLDALQAQAVAANPGLRAAVARVEQARAIAAGARAQAFPQAAFAPSVKRERTSGNLPTPVPFPVPSAHIDTFSLPFDVSYEIDLWGRVRRMIESAQAEAQASAADYEHVLLTLTADVAINFALARTIDAEAAAIRHTVRVRQDSLRLLEERYAAGVITGTGVAQARALLASAEADLADLQRQHAEVRHALALLCGRAPGDFELPRGPAPRHVAIPAALPSTLLERRPDIARAERALAARNAQIGVARAAYFPSVQLVGQGGLLSDTAGALFSADSRVWSIGPRVSLPLFTAGRTAADVQRAESAYDEALAAYRLTVLAALREVEDALAAIVLRGEQASAGAQALRSAREVVTLAQARYDAGTANYLEVADAERTVLAEERRISQLEGQRLAAVVRLIKALGGGW
ncbi:MAG TPA: efflux transporter outer membrane subunit [Burkholderiales bacterium]|nr:efflux transporter outer membrane subunit [Burkholderiales bacterium]